MAENKKQEFLQELSEKLSEGMSAQEIMSQIQYYAGYIDGEMARGKSAEEAIEDLGDPILIARTILESPREEDLFFGRTIQNEYDAYAEGNYQGENQISTDEIRAAVRADLPLGEEIPREFYETDSNEGDSVNQTERRETSADKAASTAYAKQEQASQNLHDYTKDEVEHAGKATVVKKGIFRDEKGDFRWDLFAVLVTIAMLIVGIVYAAVNLLVALGPVLVGILAAVLIVYLIRRKKS